jgi:hypothetical protein
VSREVWSALGEPTVNRTSPVSQPSARPRPTPAALLGADHPLVRDLERLAVGINQAAAVAAVMGGSVAAWLERASAAPPIVASAVAVELVLAARVAVLLRTRRLRLLELISEGRADLPIAALERLVCRIRCARHRGRIASSVDSLLAPTAQRWDLVMTPWRFRQGDVVPTIQDELVEIAARLRDGSASLSGIALIELLLTDGTSSLHGDDPRRVHEELGRVRYLLS